MPTVVKTETSAARNSTSSMMRSRMMRARRRARRSLRSVASIRVVWPATADIRKSSAILQRARLLQLGVALQQLVDRHADLGHAAEHGAFLAFLDMLERDAIRRGGQRHVFHFGRERGAVL